MKSHNCSFRLIFTRRFRNYFYVYACPHMFSGKYVDLKKKLNAETNEIDTVFHFDCELKKIHKIRTILTQIYINLLIFIRKKDKHKI